MNCTIALPANWTNADKLERALIAAGSPHSCQLIDVQFPIGCKVMVDAAIRLLSLINQLDICTRRVRLIFEEGEKGTMGYLNRIGFFDYLPMSVEVSPKRPAVSGRNLYAGGNASLVEIERINKDHRDPNLPDRLTNTLMQSCSKRADAAELEGAAWTIFAELIDNVFSHSETKLDGYAALQVYSGGDQVRVAVSDSGLGIMKTLRPSLRTEFPRLTNFTDTDLLVEVFREGISRHGPSRGCGLKGSAAKAIKFRATLDVRMPTNRVQLIPALGSYRPNTAYCNEKLPLIWGTHLCFSIRLNG